MKIDLQYPIASETGPIGSLTLRRPTANDLKAISAAGKADEFDAGLVLVSRLSGLTLDQVGAMDAEDFIRASEAASDFLPKRESGPTT